MEQFELQLFGALKSHFVFNVNMSFRTNEQTPLFEQCIFMTSPLYHSINPFIPESDQFQISPAAPPEI